MAYPHGHPLATSRAQDSESTSAKDQCSTAGPRNQLTLTNLYNANKPTYVCLCVCHFTAIASAAYEKASVLFVIGAMQTQVANCQDLRTDDGLKLAAKLFQVALRPSCRWTLSCHLCTVSFPCCWSSNRKRVQPGKSHASTSHKVFSKLILIIHSFPF